MNASENVGATHALLFSEKSLDETKAQDVSFLEFVDSETAAYKKIQLLEHGSPNHTFFVLEVNEYGRIGDDLIRVTRKGKIQRSTMKRLINEAFGIK